MHTVFGGGLCEELITRSEESYLTCVCLIVGDLETITVGLLVPSWTAAPHVFLLRFWWILNIIDRFSKNIQVQHFMKISPVWAKMLQAGGQIDGRTDMTNVIVGFSSFAKVPEIQTHPRTHAHSQYPYPRLWRHSSSKFYCYFISHNYLLFF
jgi:hypothetical protein